MPIPLLITSRINDNPHLWCSIFHKQHFPHMLRTPRASKFHRTVGAQGNNILSTIRYFVASPIFRKLDQSIQFEFTFSQDFPTVLIAGMRTRNPSERGSKSRLQYVHRYPNLIVHSPRQKKTPYEPSANARRTCPKRAQLLSTLDASTDKDSANYNNARCTHRCDRLITMMSHKRNLV